MTNKQWTLATVAMTALVVSLLWTGTAERIATRFQPEPPQSPEMTDFERRKAKLMVEVEESLRANRDASGTLVAIDEQAFNDMISAAVANDSAALRRLGAEGRIFSVPAGTQMRTIGAGLGKRRVSILSGPQAGRSGWVAE